MNKTILDTDIFSEVLKARDLQVVARATAYRVHFQNYTITAITVMEIVKGLHKLQQPGRVQQFVAQLPGVEVFDLNIEAAELARRIYADLE